jgi:hypothetical protein
VIAFTCRDRGTGVNVEAKPRGRLGLAQNMDNDVVNPGDRHVSVLPVGPDLVEGVSGFGDPVRDALRDLAAGLIP